MKRIKFVPEKYQRLMIDFGSSGYRSAVFAGMGLGKTVTTLKILFNLYRRGRLKGVLLFAPKRVINSTWPCEIAKWDFCCLFRVANLRTKEGRKAWNNGSADIYLCNYEMIPTIIKELIDGRKDLPVNMVVFDELHNAKNPSSKRINAFRRYIHHFPYRLGLTGTPHPNNYADLFAQIRLIDDGEALGKHITKFMYKYFFRPNPKNPYKWELRKGSKEKIERAISHLTITMSSEDWLRIPETDYHDIEINLDPRSRQRYKELEKELLIEIDDGTVEAVSAAALVTKLLQLASGAVYDRDGEIRIVHDLKIQALKKLLPTIKDNVLLVYNFDHERERIMSNFKHAVRFDEREIGKWNDGKIKLWVAQAQEIKEGLNLQFGGHTIVWFTPTYNYGLYVQLNARLARMGQTFRTQVYRLIAVDTYDEAAVEALEVKGEGERGLFSSLKLLQQMRKH